VAGAERQPPIFSYAFHCRQYAGTTVAHPFCPRWQGLLLMDRVYWRDHAGATKAQIANRARLPPRLSVTSASVVQSSMGIWTGTGSDRIASRP
jgi:hypothetical protein